MSTCNLLESSCKIDHIVLNYTIFISFNLVLEGGNVSKGNKEEVCVAFKRDFCEFDGI